MLGIPVVDSSVASGQPGRRCRIRCCLLFWTGDYPAQAAVSGMHAKCCHWCEVKSFNAPEVNRRCWSGMRRHLRACLSPYLSLSFYLQEHTRHAPTHSNTHTHTLAAEDHSLRDYHEGNGAQSKRRAERRPAPRPRTHESICRAAEAQRDHVGYKKDAPYKTTGVKETSGFSVLPYFDLVWDVLPDMMHIVPVMWKGHIFQMFRGTRAPAAVKARKKYTAEENKQLFADHEEAKEHLKDWTLSKVLSLSLSVDKS